MKGDSMRPNIPRYAIVLSIKNNYIVKALGIKVRRGEIVGYKLGDKTIFSRVVVEKREEDSRLHMGLINKLDNKTNIKSLIRKDKEEIVYLEEGYETLGKTKEIDIHIPKGYYGVIVDNREKQYPKVIEGNRIYYIKPIIIDITNIF